MYDFKLYWALALVCSLTECVSICAIASLVGILIGIRSSAVGLSICTITAGIKKSKSMITKKKKKHNKTAFLAKTKLNSLEVLIYSALINSNNSPDELV